ncbi:MAG TPA: phage head closure protein [Vicinamibacterales bacterium]|nr:phage head closure protein [Vicinamibacterales bacterium]
MVLVRRPPPARLLGAEIGRLRQLVTIERKTVTADPQGGRSETWTPIATDVWAEVTPLSGRELLQLQAQQVAVIVTHRVRIWYRAGLSPQMRLRLGSRVFQIETIVDPDERHVELELLCAEVQA